MTNHPQPSNSIQQRKDDHLQLALDLPTATADPFQEVRLIHHSLPETDIESVSLTTTWADTHHQNPFYINAMTGGSDKTYEYNRQLARLARENQLAIASGSVSAALQDPSLAGSFQVIRRENPDGFVLANLGAHHSLDNAKRAVDLLAANALQIHLNAPQEIVMPEGDRHFSMWLKNIADMVESLAVPVIVKEVGFGMSRETIQALIDVGVQTVDVAGKGGTNFINIENHRRDHLDFNSLIDFGQTTPESLLESLPLQSKVDVLASGGINNFTQVIKALALGAKGVGVAGHFLRYLESHGEEATNQYLRRWQEALQAILLMMGCKSIAELQQHPIVLEGNLLNWAHQRQIDVYRLANRT